MRLGVRNISQADNRTVESGDQERHGKKQPIGLSLCGNLMSSRVGKKGQGEEAI